MTQKQLSDGNTAGSVLGQDAADKVGFWGATPVAQPANVVDATDAATAISKLNEVIAALESVGILASS